MAVLNDYNCLAHGHFESMTGHCPHGCSRELVSIVHLKAPGLVSGRTKGIDKTLQGLAKDHGLSDMNNHNGTTGAFIPDPSMTKADRELQARLHGNQTFAGSFGQDGVGKTLASNGFVGDNALNNDVVKSMIQPPRPNIVGSWSGKD